MWNPSRNALTLGAILTASLATPAAAETKARLVDCESGSCLLVTGHRESETSAVSINGHAVVPQGAHRWRVSLPVQTLREWSVPFARTIAVAVADIKAEAALPIGLLGRIENLAFLTITAK